MSAKSGGVRKATGRVVAVVLNWNSWADTVTCVQSLLRSEHLPEQIVICDNGSIDDSIDNIRRWAAEAEIPFEYFHNPSEALASLPSTPRLVLIDVGENLGYAGGNNVGIRYAIARSAADFVWILNSDVVVGTDALDRMLEVAALDESIGIVGAKLLCYDAPDKIQALGGGYIIPVVCHDTQLAAGRNADSVGEDPIALDHIVGASLLVRAGAIRRVGLIDESYFLYREETDWCIRMRRSGWQLFCATQAAVWHKQSRSIGFKSPLHDYYAVRNMLHLVRKFYPSSLPAVFCYFAARSLVPKVLRGEFSRISAVFAAYRDFIAGVSGRSRFHPDRILMQSYKIEPTGQASPQPGRPALRRAVASGVFAAFAMLATAVGTTAVEHGPTPKHHSIFVASARDKSQSQPEQHQTR